MNIVYKKGEKNMSFGDQIRSQVYVKDALEREQLSHAKKLDLDQICEECLRAEVDRLFEWILNEGANQGNIVNENENRFFRIELKFDQMRYMYFTDELRNYINSLDLPKNQTYTSDSGLYELTYETGRYKFAAKTHMLACGMKATPL